MELLGPNPSYKYVFNVSMAVHEAPVYAPVQNKLFLSQLAPPPGFLPQLVVDLNQNPPTLSEFLSDPPVYANNGGTFRNGLIVWGASGGNNSIGGGEQRVSLRTLDPATNKTNVLLNNYYGLYFNTIDDVAIHPVTKDIFFTDPGALPIHCLAIRALLECLILTPCRRLFLVQCPHGHRPPASDCEVNLCPSQTKQSNR